MLLLKQYKNSSSGSSAGYEVLALLAVDLGSSVALAKGIDCAYLYKG